MLIKLASSIDWALAKKVGDITDLLNLALHILYEQSWSSHVCWGAVGEESGPEVARCCNTRRVASPTGPEVIQESASQQLANAKASKRVIFQNARPRRVWM